MQIEEVMLVCVEHSELEWVSSELFCQMTVGRLSCHRTAMQHPSLSARNRHAVPRHAGFADTDRPVVSRPFRTLGPAGQPPGDRSFVPVAMMAACQGLL